MKRGGLLEKKPVRTVTTVPALWWVPSQRATVAPLYFAILNHGVPVPEARRRQDRFVRALLQHLASVPWSYQRGDVRPAIARAEISLPQIIKQPNLQVCLVSC